MVLQSHPHIILLENIGKNAKKSCYMEFRGFQDISVIWYRSHCKTHTHQAPPSETWWKITTISIFASL